MSIFDDEEFLVRARESGERLRRENPLEWARARAKMIALRNVRSSAELRALGYNPPRGSTLAPIFVDETGRESDAATAERLATEQNAAALHVKTGAELRTDRPLRLTGAPVPINPTATTSPKETSMPRPMNTFASLIAHAGSAEVVEEVDRQPGRNRVEKCMALVAGLPEYAGTPDYDRVHAAACDLHRALRNSSPSPVNLARTPALAAGGGEDTDVSGYPGRNRVEQCQNYLLANTKGSDRWSFETLNEQAVMLNRKLGAPVR